MALAVDLNTAKFTWSWSQGTGGTATGFEIGLGTAAGTYGTFKPVALAARELAVNQVVTTPGTYVAAIRSVGPVLKSGWSNEVTFQGEIAPLAPTAFAVA